MDYIEKFMFENHALRGQRVQLHQSLKSLWRDKNATPTIRHMLAQFCCAGVLLAANLKFKGSVILQAQGSSQIRSLMAECRNQTQVRGIARLHQTNAAPALLFDHSQLAITLAPDQGQHYQGIVQIQHDNLGAALEEYFLRSEQLPTKFWFAVNEEQAVGFMLQMLPKAHCESMENAALSWQHVTELASTIEPEELLQLSTAGLLHRLYHQDQVRLFKPNEVYYQCTCSQERSGQALKHLGLADARLLLAEKNGCIQVDCEFCGQQYEFNSKDIDALYQDEGHLYH